MKGKSAAPAADAEQGGVRTRSGKTVSRSDHVADPPAAEQHTEEQQVPTATEQQAVEQAPSRKKVLLRDPKAKKRTKIQPPAADKTGAEAGSPGAHAAGPNAAVPVEEAPAGPADAAAEVAAADIPQEENPKAADAGAADLAAKAAPQSPAGAAHDGGAPAGAGAAAGVATGQSPQAAEAGATGRGPQPHTYAGNAAVAVVHNNRRDQRLPYMIKGFHHNLCTKLHST